MAFFISRLPVGHAVWHFLEPRLSMLYSWLIAWRLQTMGKTYTQLLKILLPLTILPIILLVCSIHISSYKWTVDALSYQVIDYK